MQEREKSRMGVITVHLTHISQVKHWDKRVLYFEEKGHSCLNKNLKNSNMNQQPRSLPPDVHFNESGAQPRLFCLLIALH